MPVFIDTSALYALLDRDDANASVAGRIWQQLLSGNDALLISNYILVETTALAQHRLGIDAVRSLYGDFVPVLDVQWITTGDHAAAVAALLSANQRKVSLVDWSNFTLMRRLGLRRAFAFDLHFRAQGFTLMR